MQPIAKGGGGRTLKWRWPSSTSVLVACAALVVLTTLVVALNPSTIFPFMTAAMPTTTLIGWKIKEAVPRCEKVVELPLFSSRGMRWLERARKDFSVFCLQYAVENTRACADAPQLTGKAVHYFRGVHSPSRTILTWIV